MEVDGRWVYFPSPDCLWVAYNLDGLLHIQFNDGTVRKTECPMTGFFMLIKDNCVYFHKKYDVEGTLYNVSEDTHVSIDISDRKVSVCFETDIYALLMIRRMTTELIASISISTV